MHLNEIKDLECSLHDAKRANRQWLEKVLHQDFMEITRSGILVDRQETIAALTTETAASQIMASDFHLQTVNAGCVILTYRTMVRSEAGTSHAALRSSCWTLTERTGWQLLFHQVTPDVSERRNGPGL
ncbi:DUF4440 domain-containing protein [Ewingella sp. S1.OA.A_B6]